ncbi:nuclease [Calothrix sp. NIES-4071]|nr:nuclease [Calothrix sp. NIES-4071]BAZ59445.1 nuclease [Calothrix sp. NIES-4105]
MELLELILVLGTVVGLVDGNTIRVKDNTGQPITVRLACIVVPSSTNQQATQKLKQLLPAGSLVVVRTELPKDGRTIGEIFVDNKSVNLKMVEEGNAVVDRKTLEYCNETKTQFLIAEATAKNKRLGLWQQSDNSTDKSKTYSLHGKLIYEEVSAVMSPRAYQGEEFFLITNGSKKRLVLRPSAQVSRTQLQSFQNQEVELKAVYVEATRPSPHGNSACPVDINGQCTPQGNGYQVLSITPLVKR